MDAHKRLFSYLARNHLKTFGIFWLILGMVNILAAIVSYRISVNIMYGPMLMVGENVSFAGSNLIAVLIFFIVYSMSMYYESFSLAGGFGITRNNFYIQAIVSNIIVAGISGIIQVLLLKLDIRLIEIIGGRPMVDFGYFNMKDDLLTNILIVSFSFMLCISLGNLLGILVYRFSYRFWIGLALVGFLVGLFLGNFPRMIFGFITNAGYLTGFMTIIIAYGIGYLAIRRINIK